MGQLANPFTTKGTKAHEGKLFRQKTFVSVVVDDFLRAIAKLAHYRQNTLIDLLEASGLA